MTLAIIDSDTVTNPITQASMTAAVQTGMSNAGFTLFDSISGTTNTLIYQQVFNDSAKGTAYFRIEITSSTLRQQIGDNWNASTDTGVNFLGPSQTGYSNTSPVTFYSFNHPETRLVIGIQGSNVYTFGYIRPANKAPWWNENEFLYCFAPNFNINNSASFHGPSVTPFLTTTSVFNISFITSENGFYDLNPDGTRDLIIQPLFVGNSTNIQSMVGRFSSDICVGTSVGLNTQDIFKQNPGLEEYSVIFSAKGSDASTRSSALGVRII